MVVAAPQGLFGPLERLLREVDADAGDDAAGAGGDHAAGAGGHGAG
jgi:hypothetical protein